MKFSGQSRKNVERPGLITDVNGKIIFINDTFFSAIHGIKIGDDITIIKPYTKEYVQKITMYQNKMEIVKCDFKNYKYALTRVISEKGKKFLSITFFKDESIDESILSSDENLLSSFFIVANDTSCATVNLKERIEQIIDVNKEDPLLSFRKIDIIGEEDIDICTYIDHLSIIIVGALSVMNEVNYKSKVKITIEKEAADAIITVSVPTNVTGVVFGEMKISELFPFTTIRLVYLSSLCSVDKTNLDCLIENGEFKLQYRIKNVAADEGKLRCAPSTSLRSYVQYIMSIFSYKKSKREEE